MMGGLQYSVLRYSPSLLSGESINLGILFSTENFARFEYTKKTNRIREFDDTLDMDVLKILLESIKSDVEGDLITQGRQFNISDYIKFYRKEYHFSNVIDSTYKDDLEKRIEEIKKIYLRFDYEVSQRPSIQEELLFLRSLLSDKGNKVRARASAPGKHNETVRYDFIMGNYGIKYFSLNNDKDLRKIMNDVKAWAWNSEHYGLVRPVIVYNTDITDKSTQQYTDLQSIIDIFKESSLNVYSLENVSTEFNPEDAN